MSSGYEKILPENYKAYMNLRDAWKDPLLPERQWKICEQERQKVLEGKFYEVGPYNAFIEACYYIGNQENREYMNMLDAGASSGFYHDLLMYCGLDDWSYTALDYSEAFRDFAKKQLPHVRFDVGDMLDLPYGNKTFDIVVACITQIHIDEWQQVVKELSRVSYKYVMLHRVPVLWKEPTTMFRKEAYGVPCIETWFNYDELMKFCESNSLRFLKQWNVYKDQVPDHGDITMVFEKK